MGWDSTSMEAKGWRDSRAGRRLLQGHMEPSQGRTRLRSRPRELEGAAGQPVGTGLPVWGRAASKGPRVCPSGEVAKSVLCTWEDSRMVWTECMPAQRDSRAGYKTGTRSAAVVLFRWALLGCPPCSPALPRVPGREAACAQGSAEGQRPQPGSQAPSRGPMHRARV